MNPRRGLEVSDKDEVISDFRDYLRIEKGRAPRTVRQHVNNAEEILDDFDGVIDRDSLRDWIGKYKDGDFSKSHVANKVKSIRVFTRYLGIEQLGKRFKIPSPPPQPTPAPRDEDVKRQFEATADEDVAALYLTVASSGLRIGEAWSLRKEDIDLETGMLTPRSRSRKKKTGITFVNDEALEAIRNLPDRDGKIFGKQYKSKVWYWFDKARKAAGTDIRPQDLRIWFADKMGRLGVADRYIDAFCGRVPKSVLANHYTDFSPSKLKRVYERADLKVLS